NNAKELAKTTLALLSRLEGCNILGVWGGVFQNKKSYLEMFMQSINEKLPHIKVALLPNPPVIGAVTAAIKEGEKI
ncbi:MAG TPA: hypothetical protein PKN28_04150, partial [Clostridiales bacterium]|nr:hypothetical protein [Clostridiales bacterium]